MAGNDIELDYTLIGGALNLMALSRGNNLDQETIRRAEEFKRMFAGKSKDESQGRKLRVEFTVPKKSRYCKGNPKRKIWKSDQPATSTSRAEPGPSSRSLIDQPSTSRAAEPGPSSRALDQPAASTSRAAEPHPSSAISAEGTRPPVEPSLPVGIQGLIGLCSMPIQKQITASDVNHGLGRLLLPKPQMKKELNCIQLNPNEDIKGGIPVTVYGPDGGEYAMDFIFWSAKFYVLKRTWIQFCQDYRLSNLMNKMETLTIWMFRHRQTNGLCFAITW